MPDKTANWGVPGSGARYRTQDSDPTGGGNFRVAQRLDSNGDPVDVLLEWDETAGEWVYGGPVNLDGGDVTNVGAFDANSVSTDDHISTRDNKVRQVGPNESIQSALDAVGDSDARRSGVVKVRGAGETGDFIDFANDTLPIVPPEGTTLDLTGVGIIYSDPVSDAVFSLQHPRTTIIAPGATFWFTGGGSGDIIQFSDASESLASREAPQVFGYPLVRTDGEFVVGHDVSNANSVAGCYSEVRFLNAANGVRFSTSGSGGFLNGNLTRILGTIDTGDVAVFEGTETVELNRVEVDELNILTGVNHVGLWDGADVRKNVIRGTWFDEKGASTPYEWTSDTGGNNKAVRRNTTVASGTNNSGDSTNESIADMTL